MRTKLSLETGMPFDYMELPDRTDKIDRDTPRTIFSPFKPFKLIKR